MRMYRPVLLFFAIIVLDQLTKLQAQKSGQVILNEGISFGLLNQLPSYLLHSVSLVFLVVVGVLFWKKWRERPDISALFLGSAVSNLIDRIWWYGVRDWLPIPFVPLRNNLADWVIFLSLLWIVILEVSEKKVP